MLYFFCIENYFEENVNLTEAGRVLYYDVPVEQLRRENEIQAKYNQCAITFELTYKLPELFIEDEADSDRFLQLLEELIPDNYDNHQMFGEPFSVQEEVLYETGEYMGVDPQQMTLLFQIDSDHKNCNMVWGELGMLYFCINNEDLKINVLKIHAVYYKHANEKGCSFKKNNLLCELVNMHNLI